MPDYTKVNDVASGSIAKINDVAPADIALVNDVGAPSGTVTATHWAISCDDRYASWAAAADIATESVWASNVWVSASAAGSSVDTIDIAYGKDNSGDGIFLTIGNSSGQNVWVDQNNDITDSSNWSRINLPDTAKRQTIQWGNDVWVAAGEMGNTRIHRSTDGAATFSSVNVSGLTNIVTGTKVTALASDGAANWMFGQGSNLYFSSDDAASWAFLLQPEGTGNTIHDIVFTNNTWVVVYNNGGAQAWVITCPASTAANMDATSDWGTAQRLTGATRIDKVGNSTTSTTHLHGNLTKRMAAAGGRVVFLQSGNANATSPGPMALTTAADVNGKTCTLTDEVLEVPLSSGASNVPNCISTDGTTWLIGADGITVGRDGGEICRSTNGGDSWTLIVEGINDNAATRVNGIAPNVYLPL